MDMATPNHGAIDWARGADGFALAPREIFDAARAKGAELVEVNHPRAPPGALSNMMEYFDRSGLYFDYDNRVIGGDIDKQPISNDWLRLPPGVSMWDDTFNVLEVWSRMKMEDSDADGRRENQALDVVMRDWFNFLSFGMQITPTGNSDTHTVTQDPMGIPRTMVAVSDDSPDAVQGGSVVDDVIDTLASRGGAPRDVVVTDGPMIRVTKQGETASVIGRTVDASASGTVTFTVSVESPTWAPFDTIEVFANSTPDITSDVTALQPIMCFTPVAEADMDPNDPCRMALLGSTQLTVDPVEVAPGFSRYEATVDVTIDRSTLPYPDGGTGKDAWVVVRARGDRGMFPMYLWDTVTDANVGTLVSAGSDAERDAAMAGVGIPAEGFTGAIYVDFDGGGYRAQFAPQ
jgi:hypothetical protein